MEYLPFRLPDGPLIQLTDHPATDGRASRMESAVAGLAAETGSKAWGEIKSNSYRHRGWEGLSSSHSLTYEKNQLVIAVSHPFFTGMIPLFCAHNAPAFDSLWRYRPSVCWDMV